MRGQPLHPHAHQSPVPRMPTDKQPVPSNQKPFTPALSSNFRAIKSPLTPRLAGSAPNSPSITARREALARTLSPGRDNPPITSLDGNITPRSGARKSRLGTESPSSPAITKEPALSRPRATTSGVSAKPPQLAQHGLGIASPPLGAPERPRLPATPMTSPTPVYTVHRRISGSKSTIHSEGDLPSKFFRADDAKSSVGSPGPSEGPAKGPDNTSFFYVGSSNVQHGPVPATGPPSGVDVGNDEKFFRANDIPPQSTTKTSVRPVLKTVKSLASVTSVRSQPSEGQRQLKSAGQPTSPTKDRKIVGTQPSSPKKGLTGSATVPASPIKDGLDRRRSIGSNASHVRPISHRKSSSASSLQKTPVQQISPPRPSPKQRMDLTINSPSNAPVATLDRITAPLISLDTLSPRSTSLASSNTVPTSITSDTDHSETQAMRKINETDSNTSAATQPTRSASIDQPSQTSQNDNASNARRERKVLDLEISNSSLLAINKTLERELRKQSTELRRFRRLTRSGRLSIAPTDRTVSGSTLDTVAETNDEDVDLSDLASDSDTDLLDDEDSSLFSNDSNSVLSPSSTLRQRARDEKRLMLDLSKHQQMLIDSQKLSQSIRRCLTCTEELIRDGNKALEYRVGIGDLKLGGRVLSHDDLDERTEDHVERQGLLSPSLTSTALMDASQWVGTGPGAVQTLDGMRDLDLEDA